MPNKLYEILNLPKYLESFIFDELEGRYNPNFDTAQINLYNDLERNKDYIGTYFPRSFGECYNIFNNLIKLQTFKNELNNKQAINILDIGTGTGGNLIGFLEFFRKNNLANKQIIVYTIEGNQIAIDFQKKFIDRFNLQYNSKVKLISHKFVFGNKKNIQNQLFEILSKINITNFDFITTFKFICEFYNTDFYGYEGTYKIFTETLINYLNTTGLLLILDVTTKDNKIEWLPVQINKELNSVVNKTEMNVTYVLPICCAFWHSDCHKDFCFPQKIFYVKHKGTHFKDRTSVTYKLIAKNIFGNQLKTEIDKKPAYIQKWKINANNIFKAQGCSCAKFVNNDLDNIPDAYEII